MSPRIRTTRAMQALKENICVVKYSTKSKRNVTRSARNALADKTNSLSDDNVSIEVSTKPKPTLKKVQKTSNDVKRPNRNRRLPTRYVENVVLNNLSNSKESPTKKISLKGDHTSKRDTPVNNEPSPIKTPMKDLNNSLVVNRPKRICRLPSKFEDHSISPSKFIPVQPCHASTPIATKNIKDQKHVGKGKTMVQTVLQPIKSKRILQKKSNNDSVEVIVSKDSNKEDVNKLRLKKTAKQNIVSPLKSKKTTRNKRKVNLGAETCPDDLECNNKQLPNRNRKGNNLSPPSPLVPEPSEDTDNEIRDLGEKAPHKRLFDTHIQFKVLEDKKASERENDKDVYEFTFDPNEEPVRPKKKRKRVANRKPAKPKTVVHKNNYEKNVSTALEVLKNKVTKKPAHANADKIQIIPQNSKTIKTKELNLNKEKSQVVNTKKIIEPQNIYKMGTNIVENTTVAPLISESLKTSVHEPKYASIRVEDIAADFEPSLDGDNIDYSPVNSPSRPRTPEHLDSEVPIGTVNDDDPLNLRDDESFFGDQPVASSSMNVSVRHPLASPWRVEFHNLPIKWQANTYVKPNMTPAVECSFINAENINKKKHVYTNMVVEENEPLPQVMESNGGGLKQTSIISFMKEVAERSFNKKKRGRSLTPTKANSIFEDISNVSGTGFGYKTPKRAKINSTPNNTNENMSNSNNSNTDVSNDKETAPEPLKEVVNVKTKKSSKSPKKRNNKDRTYFGFDDSQNSENVDLENISPVKIVKNKVKTLRSRLALKEMNTLKVMNAMTGPIRADLPLAAKTKITTSAEAVNKVYEGIKSADDAPTFPQKEVVDNTNTTNLDDPTWHEDNEDGDAQSVHLFEDVEIVHHLKPTRKSYGKSKKVTFQRSNSHDSDASEVAERVNSSDEEDLSDLNFKLPEVKQKKQKKKKPKKQLSKKEQKEVEEWAAGFNSMCEDIDDFPLLVE